MPSAIGIIQKSCRCVWYGPISSTSRMIATTTPAIRGVRERAVPPPLGRRLVARVHPGRRAVLRDVRATTLHPLPWLPCSRPRARPCGATSSHSTGRMAAMTTADGDDRRRTPRRPRPRLHRLDRHAGAGRDRRAGRSGSAWWGWRPAARTSRCSPRRPGARRAARGRRGPGRGRRAAPGAAGGRRARRSGRRHRAHRDDARRHRAQRDHRLARPGPDARRAGHRRDAGAGEQGVAGRGRRRW